MKTRLARLRAYFDQMPRRYGIFRVPQPTIDAFSEMLDLFAEIIQSLEDNEKRRVGDRKK